MRDLRYLKDKEKFLEYAYLALSDHFASHNDFINYFNMMKTDERKNLFLKTASFYLFLVKRGDWIIDIPNSKTKVLDYLTNTYKFMTIFSLIESLSEKNNIDFHEYLIREKSQVEFPINKKELNEHYRKYKDEFGSIRSCIAFFRALSPDRQHDLISKMKVRGDKPAERSIGDLAKDLYEMRSKFVHEAKLVLPISKGTFVSRLGNKLVVCNLSIEDVMRFFEEGLLGYFRETLQEHKN